MLVKCRNELVDSHQLCRRTSTWKFWGMTISSRSFSSDFGLLDFLPGKNGNRFEPFPYVRHFVSTIFLLFLIFILMFFTSIKSFNLNENCLCNEMKCFEKPRHDGGEWVDFFLHGRWCHIKCYLGPLMLCKRINLLCIWCNLHFCSNFMCILVKKSKISNQKSLFTANLNGFFKTPFWTSCHFIFDRSTRDILAHRTP